MVRRRDTVLEQTSASEEAWQEAVGLLTTPLTVAQQEVQWRGRP